jgi:heat shock protein HslJ
LYARRFASTSAIADAHGTALARLKGAPDDGLPGRPRPPSRRIWPLKKIARLLSFACVVGLVSCDEDVLGPSELQGEWRLQSLRRSDFSVVEIAEPARFTARFGEDGRLTLRADCNSCGGTFRLEGEAVTAGPLACTRVFCASAPLDTQFVGILDGRSSVEVEDGRLILQSDRGSLLFAP